MTLQANNLRDGARYQLEADTATFLANGGTITLIPRGVSNLLDAKGTHKNNQIVLLGSNSAAPLTYGSGRSKKDY